MDIELIRQYASRMTKVFADQVSNVQDQGQVQDYLTLLESRRDSWAKVAQIPPDSKYWESVISYVNLLSDQKASKTQIRALYKSLEEVMNPTQTASK